MIKAKEDLISWVSVNNWIPIIGMVITVILAYALVKERISLLEQNIEVIKSQIDDIKQGQKDILSAIKDEKTSELASHNSIEDRYGKLSLEVERIKSKVQ